MRPFDDLAVLVLSELSIHHYAAFTPEHGVPSERPRMNSHSTRESEPDVAVLRHLRYIVLVQEFVGTPARTGLITDFTYVMSKQVLQERVVLS